MWQKTQQIIVKKNDFECRLTTFVIMKSKSHILFFILTICCVCGCVREVLVPKPVSYTVIEKSTAFNNKNVSFSIDSLNNRLFLRLTINQLSKEFPFPVNTKYKDTLTKTAFNFDFYSNGKLILSDYKFLQASLRWSHERPMNGLNLHSDTVNLINYNNILVELPYYALHTLKRGKQSLELHIWQDTFTDKLDVLNKDGSYSSYRLNEKKSLFNAKVKFDILLPAIYQTMVYGEGLVLRNDSTFSPLGMDNTLWKSSYPDIYWALVYPKNILYTQTYCETSTDRYVGLDTFTLYHYCENDSIGFAVYDHDNLSRDDFMGGWFGYLNALDTFSRDITFDNIKSFKYKLSFKGRVN
jgi:hypothetical protein